MISRLIGLTSENIAKTPNKIFNALNKLIAPEIYF